MALEQDLELMDNYLANRMDAGEREAFEKRLKTDTALSEEFKLQQSLVQGVRQARIGELKSMLNSIPVTSLPPTQTALLTKIGGWILATGVVATITYFYINRKESEPVNTVKTEEQIQKPIQNETTQTEQPTEELPAVEPESKPIAKPAVKETKETKQQVKPSIQAYDPTTEETETATQKYEREQLNLISNAFVTSSMEVEIHNADKKYNFHYVFKDGKLVLYGAFEKHLYEILEFISEDKKTVALYYKTNYYLLDIYKSTPTPLTPIKNPELLKKLQEHRGN